MQSRNTKEEGGTMTNSPAEPLLVDFVGELYHV